MASECDAAHFDRLPPGATHLFVSCGGNDTLVAKSYLDGIIVSDARSDLLGVLEAIARIVEGDRSTMVSSVFG